jgi:N-acetylneuraminic acid mutarotase
MPTARRTGGAGVVGGIVYLVGGYNGSQLNTVDAYNPATDSWSSKAPAPTGGANVKVAVSNGILYAFGGDLGPSSVAAYDASTDSWSTKGPLPIIRNQPGVAVLNGLIYLIGGFDQNGYLTANEVYDPSADAWSTDPQMPTARGDMVTGVVGNTIYAIGGDTTGCCPTELAVNEAFTVLPQTKDDCKNGGWQTFGFTNQGQCIKFVNHN